MSTTINAVFARSRAKRDDAAMTPIAKRTVIHPTFFSSSSIFLAL